MSQGSSQVYERAALPLVALGLELGQDPGSVIAPAVQVAQDREDDPGEDATDRLADEGGKRRHRLATIFG
jgi:hypothetical protein